MAGFAPLLGMVWLLRAAGQAQSCSPGADACTEEQVENVEEQIKNQHLSLLQMSGPPQIEIIGCRGGQTPISTQCENGRCTYKCHPDGQKQIVCEPGQVIQQEHCSGGGCSWACHAQPGPPQIEIIGCRGGQTPISTQCENGRCTYKCHPDGQQQVVCEPGKVIQQEHCSGGGCSWGCHAYVGCPEKPELVGCTRMLPATCMWSCPGTTSRLQCPQGAEPRLPIETAVHETSEGSSNWVC